MGLDLGTKCGFAYCDILPGQPITAAPLVGGIWDLSIGSYDSGALRHIRLKQFLSVTQPDLLLYEEVKYDPPNIPGKFNAGSLIARVVPTAEFMGGLKTTVVTWAEERNIGSQGVPIAQIKKFATGVGNANKQDMIAAANEQFGLEMEVEDHEKTTNDNIADALFVCAMGVELYSKGV